MSKDAEDRMWWCQDCGMSWRMYPDEEHEDMQCVCTHEPRLSSAPDNLKRSKASRKSKPYKTAQCPHCGAWHKLPPAAPLPPNCDCQKRQRKDHVSKPDPFRRFIERELKLD